MSENLACIKIDFEDHGIHTDMSLNRWTASGNAPGCALISRQCPSSPCFDIPAMGQASEKLQEKLAVLEAS